MKTTIISAALLSLALTSVQATAGGVPAEKLQKIINSSFKDPDKSTEAPATPTWASRLTPDTVQQACSEARNHPDKDLAADMEKAAAASVKYPEDGKLLGDWKNGEKIAQNGKGLRFNDKVDEPSGGNCYACHQIDKKELAFGTIGPPLTEYGKNRDFSEEAIKATYAKIYNSHTVVPCSHMPRFGTMGILTIDQIKDLTALLMDKESPVNK
ncbi:MAG: sulfur oxidation c-type cytochrome SoxX [Hyphomicrobiaceae bacterium]|nr:sulfur oxidation c-type cytochrome SoxX [Hyphomicrobiaceae bacterium]